MKKINQYACMAIIMLSVLVSCENMMDIHKKYIEDGETVYTVKLDSVKFYAGANKVYLKFWLFNAVNVKTVDLYWDEDSLIIPVTPSAALDSLTVEVPCTEEKSYSFKVRTTDVFGNHSLWSTGFANSYGDFFRQSLVNRSIKNLSDGALAWYPPASNLIRSELRYTKIDQQKNTLNVPAEQTATQCADNADNLFEVRSFFLPEPDAVDTFAVAWEEVRAVWQFPRTGWTVKYCNSWQGMPAETQPVEGTPRLMLDGNFTTFWHSRYATYAAGTNPLDPTVTRDPCPHTLVLDFGQPINIVQIDLYRRLNNNNAQTVIAYVPAVDDNALTDDDIKWLGAVPITYSGHQFFQNYSYPGTPNDHWAELGRVEYANVSNQDTPEKSLQVFITTQNAVSSQYLKLVLPNSRSNANIGLAEIYVLGK
ncbi:MAG: hypothetical protein LBL04_16705 [Bacteroidales bacterium]|jgi:hypothetical protein|nr:hypothetical protein [Bacteroidales bacterium]